MRRTVKNERQSRPVQSEVGQATIELAFTISLTLMLIFGLIECSRAIYTASVIQWAAQQGARAAIVESSAADIATVVHERMVGLNNCPVPEDCIVVSYPPPPSDAPKVKIVQVDVTYEFEFVVPLIERITGDSIQMHASASMVAY